MARPATWSAVRIAASIALVAGGIFAAWRAGWLGVAQPIREFASAVGSRTTITLRDGTTLVLGPATRLRVPADFGRSARVVELDGEGLFTVVHDARRPFIVHAGRTTIRDIGTVFTVHAYAGDPEQRIAVAEGSVALAGTTLRQGDVASVDRDGRVAVRQSSDLSTELGWAQGTLAFRGTPLGEVVHVLARTYGLHITVADSALNAAPVTATFTNESPDAVLEVVTYVVGAHYQRSGHDIVIHRGAALAAPDLRITGSKR